MVENDLHHTAETDTELAAMKSVLDAILSIRRILDALGDDNPTRLRVLNWMGNRVPAELPEIFEGWTDERY